MAMVGGVEDKGYQDQIRCWPDGASSENLIEFLLEKPRNFASKDPKGMRPRFSSFGFDWDMAQILKDLPYDKLWEIQKGIRWKDRKPQRAFETRPMDALARIRRLCHSGEIDQARKASRSQRPLEMARAKRRLAKTIPRLCRKNRDRGRVRFFPGDSGRGHRKHAEGLDRFRERTRRDRERQKRPGLSRARGADAGNVRPTQRIYGRRTQSAGPHGGGDGTGAHRGRCGEPDRRS